MAGKLGGAGDMFGDYLRVDWANLPLKVDAMDLQTQNSPDLFRKCQSLMAADKSIDGGGHSSSDSKIGPKWKPLFVPGKHNSAFQEHIHQPRKSYFTVVLLYSDFA